MKWQIDQLATYDFFILVLQAADNQVHGLWGEGLGRRRCILPGSFSHLFHHHVFRMVIVSGTFEVEHAICVDNF